MDSAKIIHDFRPFFRVHNTGHVERYMQHDFLPPSLDPQTGVLSKDVTISPDNNLSGRLYLPKTAKPDQKLPLIIYIHGGAFSIESAYSSTYHPYQNVLSSRSGYLLFSIEYRLAPEHPIPACYDDSWEAVKWIESNSRAGSDSEPWLNQYVDFSRVYLAGDSAGANIVHNMAIRASSKEVNKFGLRISGLVLIHPFFDDKCSTFWDYLCGKSGGSSGGESGDVRVNPGADMDLLANLGCERILVCVAEKDFLKGRGQKYYETLSKSDWKGEIDFFETPGEEHVFHLRSSGDNAVSLMNRIMSFMN